jgi:hypothetical protein
MKTKLFGVMFASGVLLFTCGCSAKTTPSSSDANTVPLTGDAQQSASSEVLDTGKVTDAMWLEMAAQDLYNSQTNPEAWGAGGGRDRTFAANGVTAAQLEAYGAQLNRDPAHAQELIGKMADRVKELQQQ